MSVDHSQSGSSGSSTVYIGRFAVIRGAKLAVNNGNSTLFSIPKSRD